MAEKIYKNGIIYDPKTKKRLEALAVQAGKIAAIGNFSEFQNLVQPNTQIVDLQGKTLIPAFFDAHLHLWKVGDLLTFNLDLRGTGSIAEMQDRLSDFAKKNPHLPWIRARGFNDVLMAEGRLPNKADLDKVISDRPVFAQRTCAHIAVLNSFALNICQISAQTQVPFGGEIRLGNDGQPNGILTETALGLAMRNFPKTSKADYKTMILAACEELMRHGIGAVTDPAVMPDLLEVYLEMDKMGELPMRVHAVPILLPDGAAEPLPLPELYESDNLVVNTVKFFADGGLSGQTAALSRPYLGLGTKGVLRLEEKQFLDLAQNAQAHGWQIATHAIGDVAIDLVLKVYEKLHISDASAPRHRLEHLGLPTENHLDHIARRGWQVVTQPIFLKELGKNFRQYLDADFLKNLYPLRSLLDRGIPTALSTDAPVVQDLRPLSCIESAILRMDLERNVIAPQEKITFAEALFCYTTAAAEVNQVGHKMGSLDLGKEARFSVI